MSAPLSGTLIIARWRHGRWCHRCGKGPCLYSTRVPTGSLLVIPKPHWSGREGINSHCRRFDWLIFAVFTQFVAAKYYRSCCGSDDSLAIHCYRWRWSIQKPHAGGSAFPIVYGCFSRIKKMLGRTETRTRDKMYSQTIGTVGYISRDDRARIASHPTLAASLPPSILPRSFHAPSRLHTAVQFNVGLHRACICWRAALSRSYCIAPIDA